jgi:hypothetical protein
MVVTKNISLIWQYNMTEESKEWKQSMIASISGSGAAMISATIVQPLDTAKTMQQVSSKLSYGNTFSNILSASSLI